MHAPIIAGITVAAVANELVVEQPLDWLPTNELVILALPARALIGARPGARSAPIWSKSATN